jgi:glucokinase
VLLAAVRQECPHVSAERLLSGIGLPTLHAGAAGSDALSRRTLEVFCSLLGGFAGTLAALAGAASVLEQHGRV